MFMLHYSCLHLSGLEGEILLALRKQTATCELPMPGPSQGTQSLRGPVAGFQPIVTESRGPESYILQEMNPANILNETASRVFSHQPSDENTAQLAP